MPWKWYNSKVIKIEDETEKVKRFYLEIEDVNNFEFHAGQFVTLDLPISEKRLKRWRSYSIANPPDGTNIIELCVVDLEGGLGTDYLFNEVEIGSDIKFKGPSGAFYLPEEVDKDLVMICTGTGVAPFRSMLYDLLLNNKPHKKLHLIFGTRTERDILYRNEFETLASKFPEFTYDICLSRDEHWEGYRGYVHQVYMSAYDEASPDTKFYICGWSQMIDSAVENLLIKKKIEKQNIIYELYG